MTQTFQTLQIHPIVVIIIGIRITIISVPTTTATIVAISSSPISLAIIISSNHASNLLHNLVYLLLIEPSLSILSLQHEQSTMMQTITIGIVVAITSTRWISFRLGAGAGNRMSVCVSWMCCCMACCISLQAVGRKLDSRSLRCRNAAYCGR